MDIFDFQHVTPSCEELSTKCLSPQNIEKALHALHFEGFVVLDNAVDHEHLDTLYTEMVKDASHLASLKDPRVYNFHEGNYPGVTSD